jgi:hypothetical protein
VGLHFRHEYKFGCFVFFSKKKTRSGEDAMIVGGISHKCKFRDDVVSLFDDGCVVVKNLDELPLKSLTWLVFGSGARLFVEGSEEFGSGMLERALRCKGADEAWAEFDWNELSQNGKTEPVAMANIRAASDLVRVFAAAKRPMSEVTTTVFSLRMRKLQVCFVIVGDGMVKQAVCAARMRRVTHELHLENVPSTALGFLFSRFVLLF